MLTLNKVDIGRSGFASAKSSTSGFYPQMGWFVANWLELYGEGTAHVYYSPQAAVLGGVGGGTRGENLGVNALMVVAGVHRVLR